MSNPYQTDLAAAVSDPPKSILGKIRYLGPGFILSASIVGSGELIMTTQLGAKAGFVTLWVVLLSCLVKVAVQLEFGRHAIYSGETTFTAFNQLPGPRLGRANWSIWLWLGLMTLKFLQVGGIVGGVALILQAIIPGTPIWILCVVLAILVSSLVFQGWYRPIERISLVMIGAFTLLTLASVAMLQQTEYAIQTSDLLGGMTFQLPVVALGAAVAAFGITGVGGDEIMMYNYWLIEKGYGAKTGPRRDTEEWNNRARGWIRLMYLDAILAMIAYTVVTMAFYILGAAVLHNQGLVPEGNEIIEELSSMYTSTIGPGAKTVFLVGAFVVLFSTLLSALAGWTRLFGDAIAQISSIDFSDEVTRKKLIAILGWVIPMIWVAVYLFFKKPAFMVMVGGIGTALILLIVLFAAFHFRYKRTPVSLRPGRLYDIAIWISGLAILGAGVYAVVTAFS